MPSNLRKKLLDEIWKYMTRKVTFSKSEVLEIINRYAIYAAKNQCDSLTKYNPEKYAMPISPTNLPEHIEEVNEECACEHINFLEDNVKVIDSMAHKTCPWCAQRPKEEDLIDELAQVIHDLRNHSPKTPVCIADCEIASHSLSFLREKGLLK